MKKITLLLMAILGMVTTLHAQAPSAYSFSQSSGVYTEISGGTVLGTATTDDQVFNNNTAGESGPITNTGFPIGFDFTYGGTVYDKFAVNANGWIKLGTGSFAINGTSSPISSTSASSVNVISGMGTDLVSQTGGEISYLTQGTAPNRKLVVQWKGYKRYQSGSTGNINFQIILNETTNTIQIVYGTVVNSVNSVSAEVGIKGSSTSDYSNRTSSTDWAATTAGTSSSSNITFTSTIVPPSGLSFMWTPPLPCAGVPEAGAINGSLERFICSGSAPGAISITGADLPGVPGISYQWEESVNGGTDWANVTGGTGATTATYTPPSFTGTSIQYRLKVTCTNGGGIDYSDVLSVNPQQAPATQASALMVTKAGFNAFTVSWTNGNGARRHVLVSTSPITDPVSGTAIPSYTAATAWANTGQQLVYDGTGSSVTVTGIACGTPYYVKVFEYTRCGSGPYDVYFNVTADTNELTYNGPLTAAGPLPITNNFAGFTDDNLGNIAPGWFESSITTPGGTDPTTANPSGLTSDWKSSSSLGTTTAKINLYTNTRNAWIVSPKITLTNNSRVKFKAAITNYNSASADSDGMQGTDDKVNVMVTTDCGATWTPLYVFEAANTVSLTNALTDYSVILSAYTGQTIQIGFQATDGPVDNSPDYDFHITDILFEELPSCDVPVVDAPSNILKDGVTISWTAPTVGIPTGYEYAVITSDTAPASGDSTTETSVDVTGLLSSTTYYVYVRTLCTDVYSDWSLVQTFTTLCDYPDLTGTTPGERCGLGTVELSAAAAEGDIKWYAESTGGQAIGMGEDFTTPQISETTTYYVTAQNPSFGTTTFGTGTTVTTDTEELSVFGNRRVNYKIQTIYTAADLAAAGVLPGDIVSLGYDVQSIGDGATNANYTVKIGTTANTAFANSTYLDATSYTTVYGPATYTHAIGHNTITFATPFNWDGTSNIVIFITYDGADSINNARTFYTSSTENTTLYSYNDPAATTGTLSTKRFNVTFEGQVACSGPRVPVVATVTPPPAFALSETAVTICNGETSDAVTIAEGAADYDSYVWSPDAGVSGSAAGGWMFNPTEDVEYTLLATNTTSGCALAVTVPVTVNALPNAITISPAEAEVCINSVLPLTVEGSNVAANATLGTGTTAPGATSWPNPFSAWYGGLKTQILYKAEELTAQGLVPGSAITSIAFDFEASVANACNDLRIKIGSTTNTDMTGGLVATSTLTTVYNASFTPTAGTTGFVPFTFTTPYTWTGGDIIVEVTHNQGNFGNGSGTRTRTTATSYASVYYAAKDGVTPAGSATFDTQTTYGTSGSLSIRPNTRFGYSYSTDVTWSPVNNLYTDEEATTPYVEGTSMATVYYKSSIVETDVLYTATATNDNGCSVMADVSVSITVTAAPTADVTQTFCAGATVADLTAEGEMIQWYYSSTGGSPLADTVMLNDNVMYYASQTIDGCESMTRFAITAVVNTTPAPTVEENVQVICNAGTVADLMATGTDVQWYTDFAGGEPLDPAAELESGIAIYFASQTIDGCESVMRTPVAVFVNVVETPMTDAQQSFCGSATVADLMAEGDVMWYADEMGGEPLALEAALEDGMTYYASIMYEGCESAIRAEVMVTITVVPELEGENVQEIGVDAGVDATIEDIEITVAEGATVMWYATMGDAMNGTNQLAPGAVLVSGNTYYAVQYIGDCSSAPFGVEVTITLDTRDFESANFAYWPNPVKDVLTVSYSSAITSATVYNMLGQPVISQQINALEGTINMANLSDGTYIVIVATETATKTIRVVKKQ